MDGNVAFFFGTLIFFFWVHGGNVAHMLFHTMTHVSSFLVDPPGVVCSKWVTSKNYFVLILVSQYDVRKLNLYCKFSSCIFCGVHCLAYSYYQYFLAYQNQQEIKFNDLTI